MFGLDTDGRQQVRDNLDRLLLTNLRLIVGGAPGPDEFARQWAVDKMVDHLVLHANWNEDGKRAGILRNLRMLDQKPDLVIAFWDGQSTGTQHTITEARKRGIPVEIISDPPAITEGP